MITRLETPRLVLRKAREDDLDAIWKNVWRDPAIARYMLRKPTETYAEARDRMVRTLEVQAKGPSFFVCLRETDEPIGFAGVREEPAGLYEDAGICVATAHQGKGLGREVVRALCALVFEKLGGDVFLYSCFHENARSAALCQALGFVYDRSEMAVRDWDQRVYTADYYLMNVEMYQKLYPRNQEVEFHD